MLRKDQKRWLLELIYFIYKINKFIGIMLDSVELFPTTIQVLHWRLWEFVADFFEKEWSAGAIFYV